VARLKQLGRPVKEYYNDLQSLWQEIDFRRPNLMVHAEDIKKFNSFVQENRVYTFLDGLDDRLDNESQYFTTHTVSHSRTSFCQGEKRDSEARDHA
jgi:hypothetical protein